MIKLKVRLGICDAVGETKQEIINYVASCVEESGTLNYHIACNQLPWGWRVNIFTDYCEDSDELLVSFDLDVAGGELNKVSNVWADQDMNGVYLSIGRGRK